MPTQYEKRAKKKEVKEESVQAGQAQPDFSKESYDIFFNEDTRQYMKVTVAYDIFTGLAKVLNVEPIADNQAVANYKIKEIFAKKIMKIK